MTTTDEIILLFEMKMNILLAAHNCRRDVNSREMIDKAGELYDAYKSYIMDEPDTIRNAVKSGVL